VKTDGDFIRNQRLRMGMDQETLANRVGIDVRTLRRIEQNQTSRPHGGTIRAIAEVLGCTTEELFEGNESRAIEEHAPKICRSCGAPEEDREAHFCRRCGRRIDLVTSVGPRNVSVLAVSLRNLLELSLDEETEHAVLDQLAEEARRAIELFEGSFERAPLGAIGIFGAPAAHEDHGNRACGAAVALTSQLGRITARVSQHFRVRIEVGVGLHSGRILIQQGEPTTGNIVEIATRLAVTARAGEILASQTTRQEAAALFEFGAETVHAELGGLASSALRRSSPQRVVTPGSLQESSTFVGRKAELDRLETALGEVSTAGGRVVTVVGDPGVGKSRLCRELISRTRGSTAQTYHVQCPSHGRMVPFLTVLDLCRALLDIGSDAPAEQIREAVRHAQERGSATARAGARVLLELLDVEPRAVEGSPDDVPREQRQHRLFEFVRELLRAANERTRLILIIDDAHWMDSESQKLVADLVAGIRSTAMFVVIAFRSEFLPKWMASSHVERIMLRVLDPDGCASLARALLGPDAALPELIERIAERAGGNPFFVEQIVQTLAADGNLEGTRGAFRVTGSIGELGIPRRVGDMVAARMDRLAPDPRSVLQAAAVIGMEVPEALLSAVAGVPGESLSNALVDLQWLDFLYESMSRGRSFVFKHALVRDAAYATLSQQRRKELHLAVAQNIEKSAERVRFSTSYEELASHYSLGEDRVRAAHFYEQAGDKAMNAAALGHARRSYGNAVEHSVPQTDSPDEIRKHVDLCLKWGQADVYGPALEQISVLRRAEDLALASGYAAGATRASYWIGWIRHALGDHAESIPEFERSLALASTLTDLPLIAQLHCNLGQSYFHMAHYERALEELGRALRVRAHADAAEDSWVTANALMYLALIDADRGDFPEAYARIESALDIVRENQKVFSASPLTILGVAQCFQGDWIACLRTADQMRQLARQVGAPYVRGMSLMLEGICHFHAGERSTGIEALRASIAELESAHTQLAISLVHAHLAELLIEDGQLEAGRSAAERAIARGDAGDRMGEVAAHRALGFAEACASASNPERVHRSFERARELAERRGSRRELALIDLQVGRWLLRRDETARAHALITHARSEFEGMQMEWHAAQAERAQRG
jgi:transcriptional regulator with XRE-family HTH domain/tetratricopeptide (TPR) repeat protein